MGATSARPRHRGLRPGHADLLIAGALALATCVLYGTTLLPDVGAGDIAEFQRAAPTLGLSHPTGYPLYMLLGWLWTHLPLGGSVAWRMNLLSAVAAAAANGVLYLCGRMLGQIRVIAAGAALAHATALTFWKQATIAEVYTLAALLQLGLFLCLWRWRLRRGPLIAAAALCGLALVHHRTAVFLVPGALLFVIMTRRPTRRELLGSAAAIVVAGLLYLYVPLRVAPELRTEAYVWNYITGRALASMGFDPGRLWRENVMRLDELLGRYMLPQLTATGVALAALGAVRVLRDRASAALLLGAYLLTLLFSGAYYVYDVEVFLTQSHVVAALLLGEGAMALLGLLVLHAAPPPREERAGGEPGADTGGPHGVQPQVERIRTPRGVHPASFILHPSLLGLLLLAIPLTTAPRNWPRVEAANRDLGSFPVRAIMAQPFAPDAMLLVDWWYIYEELRYLQEVEGVRRDVELIPSHDGSELLGVIQEALRSGREVYLLRPQPGLPLAQRLDGLVWRVERGQASLGVDRPLHARWDNGVSLVGYSLPATTYSSGDVVPLTLAWQSARPIAGQQVVFVHLVGPDGAIWGQQDYTPAALTGGVAPGQLALDRAGPILRPDAPPGVYTVRLGWYDGSSLRRFVLIGADGRPLPADFVTLPERLEVGPIR